MIETLYLVQCQNKILRSSVVVDQVVKSRVSNRLDSKKSDSGRAGIPKVRFGYPKSRVFCRVSCTFYSKFYVLFHKVGFG